MTLTVSTSLPGSRVARDVHWEIEQFLFDEAALLDERRWEEWLDLFADDVRYWAPTRANRLGRESDLEFAGPNEAAWFDETKEHLGQRVRRLRTGMAWAEDPPSRTRHLVANIRARVTDNADEVEVDSAFFVYRTRLEREMDMFVGRRTDLLRAADTPGGWLIARRTVVLDMTTVLAKNLSLFL